MFCASVVHSFVLLSGEGSVGCVHHRLLDLPVAERNELKSAAIVGLSILLCSSVKACLLSTCAPSGLQSQNSGEG